jgi:hypothetical protein
MAFICATRVMNHEWFYDIHFHFRPLLYAYDDPWMIVSCSFDVSHYSGRFSPSVAWFLSLFVLTRAMTA